MIGTHIQSEISADDHEYAVKKILMRTPAYLSIIICMALAEISLLYVALRPLADSGKIIYSDELILAVIFGSFFVYAVTDTNRSFKARRKNLSLQRAATHRRSISHSRKTVSPVYSQSARARNTVNIPS